jgi:Flp pilus assembly protein TadG
MKRSRPAPFASLRRDESGASAIEFAVVSIPLMLFLFGIMEYGRAIWVEEALQNTVSTISRCIGLKVTQGSSGCPSSTTGKLDSCGCANSAGYNSAYATTYAQQLAGKWGLTIPAANVTLNLSSYCPGMSASTQYAKVTITAPFSTVAAHLIPSLANKTLSATACFPNGT